MVLGLGFRVLGFEGKWIMDGSANGKQKTENSKQ